MKLTKSHLKQHIREQMKKILETQPDFDNLAKSAADDIVSELTYDVGMKFGVTGGLHGKLQQAIHDVLASHLSDMHERTLTAPEKKKLKSLEKKTPKEPFEKQYGKEKGKSIYYATLTKKAKKDA